ncbi:MAG TPA: bifunctional glycosyltransferase family 2/GtrA family protein [Bryobacteraceae bacterium]|nr:bifunctional glycosyltransferase family 2/GtrA family protein [Bryobacteraceae bacterium]
MIRNSPMGLSQVAALIPAFRPTEALLVLIERLASAGLDVIVVVDDGSGAGYTTLFADVERFGTQTTVLRHAVNLGKGAALKTGINHILCTWPDCIGVVTADADGQHHPDDVLKVAAALAEDPRGLVLGARRFGANVPFRSRFGNIVARGVFRFAVGQSLSDTQTGLRGIPKSLLPQLLSVSSNGYDFELDMLLLSRRLHYPIGEIPIETIYLGANSSSHFNPIFDSMRVFFVLLRFSIVSLLTALLDNIVFVSIFHFTGGILVAQTCGRLAALALNYTANRKTVFFSHEEHRRVLPKYLLVVVCSGIVSYGLINFLHAALGMQPVYAKIMAECVLFLANFAILRDFVFIPKKRSLSAAD